MTSIAECLYTVSQIRGLEQRLIERDAVISGLALMQRAAHAALASLRRRWPQARRLSIWCGPGNNGGDGFLVALGAHQAGLQVELFALAEASNGDAAAARQACLDAGLHIRSVDDANELPDVDVHVDALYGIGLNRAPAAPVATLIERINASGRPVLALDVPSGLDADTGQAPGAAIRADLTVSFLGFKRGLFTGAAADHVGLCELAELGMSSETRLLPPDAMLMAAASLPRRARASYKNRNGHVLAIGGDHGTAGAIRLCAEAALRSGAGLVSVATRVEHMTALNAARPELMARGVDGPQALEPMLDRADVLALGPGLGQTAWGHALWLTALESGRPLVLDADGLNLLAQAPRQFGPPAVLTPHPGEAARLLGCTTAEIERDRYAAVRELARRYTAVAVLKGAGSVVADPDGSVQVCPWGNPGMASGGMGDLLTGVIAGLLAQGCDAWQAATLGVGLHARAGDLAARQGERGLLATDLLEPLRQLVNGGGDG